MKTWRVFGARGINGLGAILALAYICGDMGLPFEEAQALELLVTFTSPQSTAA